MKTKGMKHQLTALKRMADHDEKYREQYGENFFALHMEMGTGKTWVFLAHAERLFNAGKIDGLLVIAPRGVHTNWVLREIPQHLEVDHVARSWRTGAGKREREEMAEVLALPKRGTVRKPNKLRVLATNIDAIGTKDGFAFAKKFCETFKVMIVIDESTRIKSEGTLRFKSAMKLGALVSYRYQGTGLPITNKPNDLFAQFEWMQSGLLGTTSYRAFVAEYNVLLNSAEDWAFKKMIEKNPRMRYAQIVKKDEETGKPLYRNLDKLNALLAPHSYRVLKKECTDLPDKIFKQVYFELTPKQRAVYDTMENDFRYELEDGTIQAVAKLNVVSKLQQITSGFVLAKDGSAILLGKEDNPRLKALKALMEDFEGKKVIVWAWFKEEIKAIADLMQELGRKPVQYHGGISDKDRNLAIDSFQTGDADTFIGNQASGGIGITLTAASEAIYYSNTYNLEHRAQSEDRNHRTGQKNQVTYYDIIAEDTVDDTISLALQTKTDLVAAILKDGSCLFRRGTPQSFSEKGT
jgi:SNF2 family DNA or RNA helicase